MVTDIENNIRANYAKYLNLFIDSFMRKDEMWKTFASVENTKERDKRRTAWWKHHNNIFSDFVRTGDGLKCKRRKHLQFVADHYAHVVPAGKCSLKNGPLYDVKVNPQDYWKCMFYMMDYIEKREGKKLMNVVPCRNDHIPKCVTVDTSTLRDLFNDSFFGDFSKSELFKSGSIADNQDDSWKCILKTEMKLFHLNDEHAFAFDHQIDTDGVQVSVLLKLRELRNTFIITPQHVISRDAELLYIDSDEASRIIEERNIERRANGKKVMNAGAIDPNFSQDFVSGAQGYVNGGLFGVRYKINDSNIKTIRYTRPRRNKDTKQTYYKRCRKKMTDNYQYD